MIIIDKLVKNEVFKFKIMFYLMFITHSLILLCYLAGCHCFDSPPSSLGILFLLEQSKLCEKFTSGSAKAMLDRFYYINYAIFLIVLLVFNRHLQIYK